MTLLSYVVALPDTFYRQTSKEVARWRSRYSFLVFVLKLALSLNASGTSFHDSKYLLYPFLFYLFLKFYFWLHWILVAAHGLSPVAVGSGCSLCSVQAYFGVFSGGAQALCTWATVVVGSRFSCSVARGIFQDQGSNLGSLHWQAYS